MLNLRLFQDGVVYSRRLRRAIKKAALDGVVIF